MKKYNQLLLLIISVISLTLFLIYRHEYNRLHYVLEVFNFFGQPCNISDLQQSENVLSHRDWGPTPLWMETETGYTYSAFMSAPNEARVLAISDVKKVPRNCYFWYEDKKKPVLGKFKFTKIGHDNNFNLYFYICVSSNNSLPYAVSFSGKTREVGLKKILLTKSFGHKVGINTTICVAPSSYSKRRLVEFLSYHKLIGIDSFIFYSNDIPHRLSKIITNLSTRLGMQVAFYSWNYPKSDTILARTIIENDCLLRTFGQSYYVTTLELNEYLVPKNFYNFNAMIKNLDFNSERLRLPVQRFCIKNSDPHKPIPLQNFQGLDNYNYNSVRYIYTNIEKKAIVSTYAVEKGLDSIHKYIKCDNGSSQNYYDRTMLRFSTDFTRSTLVQLLMHDQL